MATEAITTTVGHLSDLDARWIVQHMTRPGSEFQQEVASRTGSTPIAIIRHGCLRIASWAATHQWQSLQTIEGWTCDECRRGGMARAAAAMLVANGDLIPSLPVAVFSPYCVEIARSLGFRDIRLYQRGADGQWFVNS